MRWGRLVTAVGCILLLHSIVSAVQCMHVFKAQHFHVNLRLFVLPGLFALDRAITDDEEDRNHIPRDVCARASY